MANTSRLTIHFLGTDKPIDFEVAPGEVPTILEAIGTNKRLDLIKPKGDRTTVNLFFVSYVEVNDAMNRPAPGVALETRLY